MSCDELLSLKSVLVLGNTSTEKSLKQLSLNQHSAKESGQIDNKKLKVKLKSIFCVDRFQRIKVDRLLLSLFFLLMSTLIYDE